MDFLAELENMAINVVDESDAEQEQGLSDDMITGWQQLFCCTHAEAIDRINQHRSNLSRERVSDEHWEMVRCGKEAEGYDRVAYEHEIDCGRKTTSRTASGIRAGPSVGQASSKSIYILKLEGPLDTAAKIQEAAGLGSVPDIATGTGDLGEASFVTIDSTAKDTIIVWLSKEYITFAPTFIRVSKSGKELSNFSINPTLGVGLNTPTISSRQCGRKALSNPESISGMVLLLR